MSTLFLFLSAVGSGTAVALGAFGAHGLRNVLDERMMTVYQTAVQYQLWHSLGLGLLAVIARQQPDTRLLGWAGALMVAGVVLFSGSLYAFSLGGRHWLVAITPFGGTAFLAAWILTALFAVKYY
jgi:uncharacterized membrane protein YgdD (TMEM256/DUF423 family)